MPHLAMSCCWREVVPRDRLARMERINPYRALWDLARAQAVANRDYSIRLSPEDKARPAGGILGLPEDAWVGVEWQDYWLPRRSTSTPQPKIPVLTTEAGETLALLASGPFCWGTAAYWRRKQWRKRYRGR